MTVGCIVKTFIIYDMCKGEQIGIFAKSEEFRRIVFFVLCLFFFFFF